MSTPPLKRISRSYICWLAAAVLFLSVAFFLFFEDLARQGLDLFRALGKGHLSGITLVLFIGAGVLLYLSSRTEAIKKRFNRLNAAFVIIGLGIAFLLETLTRTSINPLDFQWGIDPTDLTIPLLLISVVCVFMTKKHNRLN